MCVPGDGADVLLGGGTPPPPYPFRLQKGAPSLPTPNLRSRPPAVASNPSLRTYLREWISGQASQSTADRFSPWVERALRDLGHNPDASVTPDEARRIKRTLRAADITPFRMQRALDEAQRAAEKGQSTLDWVRSIWVRAHGERLADKALAFARTRLEEQPGTGSADLQAPPTPEEILAFLLAWEELGGTALIAATRELQRMSQGDPPSN